MQSLPLVNRTKNFTAPGFSDAQDNLGLDLPLQRIPNKWSLQVTGYAADDETVVAPASWDVVIERSLDGDGYDDPAGAMIEHKSATNSNGAVVSTDANLRPAKFVRIHVVALNLGPADHIKVTLLGDR